MGGYFSCYNHLKMNRKYVIGLIVYYQRMANKVPEVWNEKSKPRLALSQILCDAACTQLWKQTEGSLVINLRFWLEVNL